MEFAAFCLKDWNLWESNDNSKHTDKEHNAITEACFAGHDYYLQDAHKGCEQLPQRQCSHQRFDKWCVITWPKYHPLSKLGLTK